MSQSATLGLGKVDVGKDVLAQQIVDHAQNAGAVADVGVVLLGHIVGEDNLGPAPQSADDIQQGGAVQ